MPKNSTKVAKKPSEIHCFCDKGVKMPPKRCIKFGCGGGVSMAVKVQRGGGVNF